MFKQLACIGSVAVLAAVSLGFETVAAQPPQPAAAHCERAFDRAVDAYIETTDERDAAGFAALLHKDVTAIFANGGVLYGKEATMGFIEPFFEATNWTQTFEELTRVVRGCKSGFVLFDSVFTQDGEPTPLVIGVTFTWERGRWLAVHNQDSNGPASKG
ncbi:YybH family protein [Nocardioides speluncae]|uniref:YybH family protein n=1 Tax=Nocardioides speluncae TaxID=2670337 RepID=UPI000D6A0333|nr:nuclear transport factor 2 family protein [Nocardioides speluncae]